jgi:hypothetical protein
MKTNKPNTPFQVPSNYFDSLTDKIIAQSSSQELGDKVSHPPFIVPPTYFQKLPTTITSRIKAHKAKNQFYFKYGIAASLAFLLMASLWFFTTPKTENDALTQVSTEQMEKYLALENSTDIEFMVESDPTLVTDSLAIEITQEALPQNTNELEKFLDDNPELELNID